MTPFNIAVQLAIYRFRPIDLIMTNYWSS